MKEYSIERQIELDIELDAGEYIILPRTTGTGLKRPQNAKSENIKLLDSNGDLHPLAELMVNDLFKRLDKVVVNNVLELAEFQEFYGRLGDQPGQTISPEDFKSKILNRFANNS
jgi:hypothetical protein